MLLSVFGDIQTSTRMVGHWIFMASALPLHMKNGMAPAAVRGRKGYLAYLNTH